MKALLALLLRWSAGTLVLAAAAGIASGAANAVLLALANRALHHPRPWADGALAGSFAGVCLLVPVLRAASSYLMASLAQRMVTDLRRDLGRRILDAPLRRLEELGTPRLLAVLTEDLAAVAAALRALPLLFVQGAIVAGCLGYLGWLSPAALGGVLLLLALGVATYRLPLARAERLQREQRELADRLWGDLEGLTGGVKELKLHAARREALLRELDETGRRIRRTSVGSATLFAAAAGWGQMVIFGLVGTIAFVLPLRGGVPGEVLTGYALVLLYLMSPLEVILDALPVLSRARLGLHRAEALGGALAPAAPPAAPAADGGGWRSLELAEVTHAYPREGEGDFTLGPVSLALRPGEIVFVVGGNGSGKTTLAKLLVGLYAPASGEVRLDGAPVDDAGRGALLQRVSAVFSDFHLFERLLGMETPGVDGRAAEFLETLQLSHRVAVRDGRLSTTRLSQGQRKRLALLTAFLEDRPICLFDEWAADQDPVFRRFFYLRLLPELRARGKTVVAITHDDQYYGVADRVIKLDAGRVEYDGPPAGLPSRAPAAAVALGGGALAGAPGEG
ncbi:cyclic peptide export ABC transporter [Longimicrobium sp.]|uniref:cyclic peptide export ABC transporter n=1 Tax=Longimicrobium sp. TaxID=2029185 RepID=UPI002E2F1D44|nr:cyclic peptide export ABC transporter [Longimicrobium sp.]HEX6038730.1 cyclic peptide export ABC transporter [Longimicrobium sp.]